MPWQLNAPINVGDLDSTNYTQVKLTKTLNESDKRFIMVDLQYGNTVDGQWVMGYPPAGAATFHMIEFQDYVTLVTTHEPNPGEKTYDAVKRALYEHLASKGVIGAGTIV